MDLTQILGSASIAADGVDGTIDLVTGAVIPESAEVCEECAAVLDDVNERTDQGCDFCDPRPEDERIHV